MIHPNQLETVSQSKPEPNQTDLDARFTQDRIESHEADAHEPLVPEFNTSSDDKVILNFDNTPDQLQGGPSAGESIARSDLCH